MDNGGASLIDIHSHILPGVDDGPSSILNSLLMARAAVQQGIQTIVATPHHCNGKYNNKKCDIEKIVLALHERLQEEEIALHILTGQETRIHTHMLEGLQLGDVATINGTKYVFVELPPTHIPNFTEQLLFKMQVQGYIPVIVHPERNQQIAEHPDLLHDLVEKGSLTQLTAASLLGRFGKRIKKLSHQLIEANLTHFIASDAHNTINRGFMLADAYEVVLKKHGDDRCYIFMENAQLMVDNQFVHRIEPVPMRKMFYLF
jgi:protein-tyrosine phosphatase